MIEKDGDDFVGRERRMTLADNDNVDEDNEEANVESSV